MSPAFAKQAETIALVLDVEGGGEEMALAEGATDLEFLADGEGLFRTHNLEFPDAAALAPFEGDEVGDEAEVVL